MIKFLHAADLHLDAPFASLSQEAAAAHRAEQRQLLSTLTELCDRENCGLLLLAGDLLDSASAYPETVACMKQAFSACRAQIFLAPGNHDCLLPGSPYTDAWPENVHIFRKNEPEAVRLPDCTVWGAAFTDMDCRPLLENFRVSEPAVPNLMVLHGELRPGSVYNAITEAQIAASGLDYLALGHVHTYSGERRAGKTAYAWPGCPMGHGFDETGEKGCLIGELDSSGCRLHFVPLPGRKYEILRVRPGDDALAAILAALPPDTSRDIYRIILEGEAAPVDLKMLEQELSPRFFGLTILDRTVPAADLWADCGSDTLRGIFLDLLRKRYDASTDEEERRMLALAARCGTAALEGRDVL